MSLDQSILDFSSYKEIIISNENIRSQPIRLKKKLAKIESQSSKYLGKYLTSKKHRIAQNYFCPPSVVHYK